MVNPSCVAPLALLALALCSSTAFAEKPDELITSPIAELFGAPATIGDPKLSPDGTRLAFLQQDESGVTVLQVLDFEDGSITSLLTGSESGHDIYECEFANATRLLCDLRGVRGRNPMDYQVWIALDSDGSNVLQMPAGTGCGDVYVLRNTHRIDWMPDDPEHVVFSCRRATQLVNIYGGQQTHRFGELNARQLYTDGHGFANLYYGRFDAHDRWFFRATDDSNWSLVAEADLVDFADPFRPVGFDVDMNAVLHIGWNEPTQTWGLFARDLETREDRVLFAHPIADAELVNTLGPYDRVVSVMYLDNRTEYHVVDQRISEVHAELSRQLPGVEIEILDESWDGKIYLARGKAPRRGGDLFLVDMADGTIKSVGPEYAHLVDTELADARLVQFQGRDGGRITGHLTLPTNGTTPAPAIIVPRGEAAHREIPDPHFLVEFLAASGFAVLRVNTPAPDELGGWLPSRAELGWEQAADSLEDAANFLVDTGVAEPDKLCAAGKDYGAYAALMSAVKYPSLFRCVISIGGIIDPREGPLAPEVRYVSAVRGVDSAWIRSLGGTGRPLSEVFRAVESPVPFDPDETSPIERVEESDVPVLMFQSLKNYLVQAGEHAVPFRNALRRSDREFEFIEYEYDDHLIKRWPYRTDMLARIGRFLSEHLK